MGEAKIGRPTIKTPELITEICERVAQGRSVASVSKDEDMPCHLTIWRWMNSDEEFCSRYARAVQARAMAHADGIDDLVDRAVRGEIPADVARVAIDAKKWTASRLLPKLYGDRTQVEATVNHTHTLHLEALKELADRARGTKGGYIEGQAIEIAGNQTFLGERSGSVPEVVPASLAGPPGAEAAATPPAPTPGGGRLRARHPRSLRTKTVDDTPPPPVAPKARPSRKTKRTDGA